MSTNINIVILGGGQAAVNAAKEIRIHDNLSSVQVISEEGELAYEKPPLSKDYITDKRKFEDFIFFNSDFYLDNKIDYVKSTKITNIDFDNKVLISDGNKKFTYDKLLIATGSINRKINLNVKNNERILSLRDNKDSDKIKKQLGNSKKILVIGGGFIGLELASSANELGKEVFIIEMNDHIMGRSIPNKISNLCKEIHEKNGNKIFLNTTIKEIKFSKDHFKVVLSDKNLLVVDLIIIGIGSVANTELFKDENLNIDNGIITNEYCETSQNDIYAAGDVSNFYHPFYKKNIRLESYQHAQNHGICAARNMIGMKEIYKNIPWMWSDQFNINIQLTGLCDDYDDIIQRGENINEGLIDFFVKDNEIRGACGIGIKGKIGRDIKLASRILENQIKVEANSLSDKNFNLSKLLKNQKN